MIGGPDSKATTLEYWMSLQPLLEDLGDGQYLVTWPGDFRWSFGDPDIVSDYLGDNSPHLVDYIGCSGVEGVYRRYCRLPERATFIHRNKDVFNFYTVKFFYKDNG